MLAAFSFDFVILDAIQNLRSPFLDKLMVDISTLGNGSLIWITYLIIFLSTKEYKKMGKVMLISFALNILIVNLFIKNIVARPRPFMINPAIDLLIPPLKDGSFPSGHTSYAFSFASIIILMARGEGLKIFTTVLAILISLSRLYLYVHFPTDVLGGAIIGVLIAIISIKIYFTKSKLRKRDKNFLQR